MRIFSRFLSPFVTHERTVPKASELPKDTVTLSPLEDATEALTHKPPALRNPVVLVNGLARDAHEWDKMVPWLTSEPSNRFGGVYAKGADESFEEALQKDPGAKVFALDPADNLASPRVIAGEVRRMIDHIVRETGAEKVDVIAHSQGGLNALAALDQGEDKIGKVISLATPWKGASIATLARTFDGMSGKRGGGLLAPLGVDQGALYDLRTIESNPWLTGAHERVSSAAEFHSLTGSGTPTPGGIDDKIVPGDGFVSVDSGLGIEGASNYHLIPGDWKPGDDAFRGFNLMDVNHLGIVGNSGAFKTVGEILAKSSGNGSFSQVSSESKRPAENHLDQGEDAVHDHLRTNRQDSVSKWAPTLDEVQELRQEIVDNDMEFRAAELKKKRAGWLGAVGAAGAVIGMSLAGPLALIPGLAAAGIAVGNWVNGERAERSATEDDKRFVSKAAELRAEIESNLESP